MLWRCRVVKDKEKAKSAKRSSVAKIAVPIILAIGSLVGALIMVRRTRMQPAASQAS